MQDKFTQGCGCSDNCFSKFSVDEVFLIRLMNEMEKGDIDNYTGTRKNSSLYVQLRI